MIELKTLKESAASLGFELAGVAPVEPLGGGWFAPHAARFEAWIEEGQHASMDYIAKRAAERVAPELLLPGVRSALVLWMNHRPPSLRKPSGVRGRIAAYARGRDYHNVLRKKLRKLQRTLLEECPEMKTYISVDTGAILERAFAERAGVGWIGRSTMLIHPRLGTFGSIAVLFTDHVFTPSDSPHPFRCGTCVACIDACPTNALHDGVLDARLCISYWTIEHRGIIPREIRPLLGDWVFGCDICQDVCPWNRKAPAGDAATWRFRDDRAWPDLTHWLTADPASLNEAYQGSPLRRARMEGLRRNALIAIANGGYSECIDLVLQVMKEDQDPVVRATAVWTATVLGEEGALRLALQDEHPLVRGEARDLLNEQDSDP